jgi:N-acetylmuramoyl-L-alanine amidase
MTNEELAQKLLPTEIMGLTIIGEARGEPIEGQVAVANVIRNRLGQYKSYPKVCFAPKQFSCWNETDPNRAYLLRLVNATILLGREPQAIEIRQCMTIAQAVIHNNFRDNTNGARHYLTKELFDSPKRPKWAASPVNRQVLTIGGHVFFNVV